MNQHRNPIDYTPKSVYQQMDADAAYDRRFRFAYKIAFILAVFIGMTGVVYLLKR